MDQLSAEAEEAAVRGEQSKVYKITKKCVVNTEETQESL
jgi:hypothetical protein